MSTHRPPPKPMDLELTIISAKHLKNVNWRNGDLTPYVIFWIEPNRTLATKADDSNNTKPVWNERFVIPVQPGPNPVLTLEVFHSKPSDTNKPLVGSLRVPLDDVINGDGNDGIRSFDLIRRSGRPNGKIRLKMSIRQRVVDNYQFAPQGSYYYTNAPPTNYGRYPPYNASPSPSVPPSPVTAPSQHSCNYRSSSDPYSGYYHGGYYAPPPPPPLQTSRPFADRPGGYGGPSAPVDYVPPPPPPAQWPGGYGGGVGGVGAGPSAPVDYVKLPTPPLPPQMPRTVDGYGSGVGGGGGGAGPSAPVDYAQYDQKQKSGKIGLGVGAVVGGMSSLSIDDGLRYEEEKVVESESNAREMDDYSDYRRRVDY